MDFGFANSAGDGLSPCKPCYAFYMGQRWSYTTWSNGFANEDFLCASPLVPDGVFFGHLQAGRNSTDFWTLPSLKSALQTHAGPTETSKGHSVHGRKALEKWKPISETEGTNHYSLSANNQPINEWINQSIDRSINESIKHRRIDRSVNPNQANQASDHQKYHVPFNRSVYRSASG